MSDGDDDDDGVMSDSDDDISEEEVKPVIKKVWQWIRITVNVEMFTAFKFSLCLR